MPCWALRPRLPVPSSRFPVLAPVPPSVDHQICRSYGWDMLSQGTGYAASALAFVAAAGGRPVLVREMAEAADVPAPYLSKLIHALARRGLVQTQRGIGGGVTLSRPAAEITLHDLCEALADPVLHARCLLGTAECSDERACPAHAFWTAQRSRVHKFLRETTVADVAAFELRRRWSGLTSPGPPKRGRSERDSGNAPLERLQVDPPPSTSLLPPSGGGDRAAAEASVSARSRTPTGRSSGRRRG